ncbi:MAG: MBOAT family O-acyltransferase [Schumannella sp.]|nr:MBOAT family protein [Microbacteriaceae bacterium]
MVFSSPTFLFAFLPLVLLGLALVRRRGFQNTWLLGMSALFYIWGAGAAVLVLLGVTLASFGLGFVPWDRLRARASQMPFRLALAGAIVLLLVPLLGFKYLPAIGRIVQADAIAAIALPIGISFFTFHAISYVVDVATAKIPRERNVRDYALYLFVFPHQIAGPIVRFAEIRDELTTGYRDAGTSQLGYGFARFSWGLAKKALVADPAGRLADVIFAENAAMQISAADAWAGAFLYALQIYFDFSAYSDMAIGLALILGFHFPENFFQPYRSISVTDFWRRWHMTLTRWFRDYVYIPMGGNRHGRRREVLALLTVFALTSLWHGAAITFAVWGALHAAMLLLERATGIRRTERFAIARRILMVVFLVVSWVPFRAASGDELLRMWQAMFVPTSWLPGPSLLTGMTPFLMLAVVIGVVSLFGPRGTTGFAAVFGAISTRDLSGMRWRLAIPLTIGLFVVAVVAILWSDFSPFLYYQF